MFWKIQPRAGGAVNFLQDLDLVLMVVSRVYPQNFRGSTWVECSVQLLRFEINFLNFPENKN